MDPAMEQKIRSILESAQDMTIATVRADGYPQATTVSYASDGLSIYFGSAVTSQKAENIARNDKVSLTINLPYSTWDDIRGISAAGRAERVVEAEEIDRIASLMLEKFPQVAQYASTGLGGIALFRVTPEVISILDYRKGFGHTDLVRVSDEHTSAASAMRRTG